MTSSPLTSQVPENVQNDRPSTLDEPLKSLGTYKVAIKVASGLTPEVTVVVEPKG